jgi:hypothetical protein
MRVRHGTAWAMRRRRSLGVKVPSSGNELMVQCTVVCQMRPNGWSSAAGRRDGGPPTHTHDTTVASKVLPKAALRADHAPPRDGRPGSWSDWLDRTRRPYQFHDRPKVIRLDGSLSNTVHPHFTTARALMNELKSLCCHAHSNRLHHAATSICSVTGLPVNVLGPQAHGAVVTVTPVRQWPNVSATMRALKANVLFASTHVLVSLRWGEPIAKRPGFRSLSPPTSAAASRLDSKRGRFTANLLSQRLLPVPTSSGPVSSLNPNHDRCCTLCVGHCKAVVTTFHR